MSKFKKLIGQTIIYGASSIIGRFLNYLLTPLFTYDKVFSPDQYGVITEMYAYVAFLVVMLTYGLETTYFRFSSKKEINQNLVYKNALTSILSTTTFFILLSFIFSQQVADWLKYPEHPEYIIWFAIIVGLDSLISIPMARLRKEEKAKKFALVNLVNIAVFISLNLFFLVYCRLNFTTNPNWLIKLVYNPEIGVGYVFISNLIASTTRFLLLIPEMKIRFGIDKKLMSQMLKYTYPLLFVGLAGIINETLDRAMLKEMLFDKFVANGMDSEKALESAQIQLGIYGANYKITMIIAMAIQAFRYAAEPFFFKESNNKNSKKTYATIMNYFIIVLSLIFLVIALNLQFFRHFTPNEIYWTGLEIVPILLLANLSLGIYYNQSIWYKLSNKTKYGALISIVGALITIAINFIFIPTYGFVASAWATLVCYVSMMIMSYYLGQKIYPIKYNLKKAGFFILSALLIFTLRWRQDLTINEGINWLIFSYHLVLILIFLGLVYFLEGKNIKKIFSKKLKPVQ